MFFVVVVVVQLPAQVPDAAPIVAARGDARQDPVAEAHIVSPPRRPLEDAEAGVVDHDVLWEHSDLGPWVEEEVVGDPEHHQGSVEALRPLLGVDFDAGASTPSIFISLLSTLVPRMASGTSTLVPRRPVRHAWQPWQRHGSGTETARRRQEVSGTSANATVELILGWQWVKFYSFDIWGRMATLRTV